MNTQFPFTPKSFTVQRIHSGGYSLSPRDEWFTTEAEALKFAREQVSPTYAQVTVTANHPDDVQTFAMIHFLWNKPEPKTWSVWTRGRSGVTKCQLPGVAA